MDLGQDHVGILGPHETGWDLIVVFEVGEDGGDEFLDALEGAAADAPLGDVAKPTLNHVEPGAAGGDEVQVEAWMPLQPALHRRALVRAVVVDDEMQSQLRRRLAVDAGQEADELAAPMARQALTNDLAVEQAEGRKQRRRAMARVIMRLPGGDAGPQRQQRRRSVQGLNLALLVHRQLQGLVWWIQVQAHDVPELLHDGSRHSYRLQTPESHTHL